MDNLLQHSNWQKELPDDWLWWKKAVLLESSAWANALLVISEDLPMCVGPFSYISSEYNPGSSFSGC